MYIYWLSTNLNGPFPVPIIGKSTSVTPFLYSSTLTIILYLGSTGGSIIGPINYNNVMQ